MQLEERSRLSSSPPSVCPHWQNQVGPGMCVDRWWAGPPVSWVVQTFITALGFAVFGLVVVSLSETSAPGISKAARALSKTAR